MARERRARHPDLLSRVGVALAGLLVGACGPFPLPRPSDGGELATEVEFHFLGSTAIWSVRPWPLDETRAFVCADDPGPAFSGSNPVVPPVPTCVEADIASNGFTLTVRLDSDGLDRAVADELAETPGSTWLALAGSQAGTTATVVVPVIESPIHSPHGPS